MRIGFLNKKRKESNTIYNPDHYTKDRKYEPRKVIRDWGLNFNLGCAVKYIARAGRKPGADITEDLYKAMRFLEFEIEALTEGEGED